MFTGTQVKTAARLIALSIALQGLAFEPCVAQGTLNYTTSWIGNSFGFGDGKWMQLDVEAIAVAPDGTVYANAPWDESGSEIGVYRGGDKLAMGGNAHGWGNAGGDAIAANGTYVYAAMSIGNESNALVGADYPPANPTWFGVTRRLRSNVALGARPFGSALVGQGAVLESYVMGTRTLGWRLYGLTFVDAASFDPANPANIFTGSKRFTLDYSRAPGKQWTYAGFTLNHFAYPDDPALHSARGVRGSPMVRRFDGQPFLYTLDEYAHYLSIYRFSPATEAQRHVRRRDDARRGRGQHLGLGGYLYGH